MIKHATLTLPDGYIIIVLQTKNARFVAERRSMHIEEVADYIIETKDRAFSVVKNRSGNDGVEVNSINILQNGPLLSIRDT